MKYSKISVLGKNYAVCFFRSPEEKRKTKLKNISRISVLPDFECDFNAFTEDNTAPSYISALSAVGEYFFFVRSLPLSELEIKTPVSIFTVEKRGNRVKLNTALRKYKFTKRNCNIKGCELELYESEKALIFKCENIDNFNIDSILPELTLSKKDGVLIYSQENGCVKVKTLGSCEPSELIISVFSLLSELGEVDSSEECEFCLSDGTKLSISNSYGKLCLSFENIAHGFFEV